MSVDTSGPAFPTYGADEDKNAMEGTMSMYLDRRDDGMSLRDYFAAKAPTMPHKLYELALEHAQIDSRKLTHREKCETLCGIIAQWNMIYAAAMLKARSQ